MTVVSQTPAVTALSPTSETELAEAVGSATSALHIQGGGTRSFASVAANTVLHTGGLAGISLYEPGALTLVAQAGTKLSEIQDTLSAEGQRLAFEPADLRGLLGVEGQSTIGGVIATNASGPRRIQAGAARDFTLGVRFVDGKGTVLKNGGRVMKNVTGYDLVKLLSGSWGSLGVLSEVSLKTQPIPETQACVLINGLSIIEAVQVMSQALGSPYELTGAAHAPAGVDGHPVTMLRIEGFEGSVSYRASKLAELFGNYDVSVEKDPAKVSKGWQWVRDVALLQDQPGDIWRVSCKPSDAPDLIEKSDAQQSLLDWGGGLVWLRMPAGRDLRAALGGFDGHATLVKGEASSANISHFHPQPPALATLSQALRAKFDPKGILNPGIMG